MSLATCVRANGVNDRIRNIIILSNLQMGYMQDDA